MPEQATLQPATPIVFVGDEQRKGVPVMARVFVRCELSTPDRGAFRKLTALDEIPLLRKLYAQYGGSVTVVGGLEHPTFSRFTIQELNDYEFRNLVVQLKRTFNNVAILKRVYNFFDDVYGAGEHCQYVGKVRSLAEEWNGVLEADSVNRLLQRHFPHVATRTVDDVLSIPGLDSVELPKVGSKVKPEQPAVKPMPSAFPPDPAGIATPQTESERTRLGATILTGAPAPDPALVEFLTDPDKTDGNPFHERQAWQVATLLTKKQLADWDATDYAGLEGLNRRNHPRIVRLVDEYLQLQRAGGVPVEDGSEDDGKAALLD